jgi:branched-chain amino acid transport system ATP-binding protein
VPVHGDPAPRPEAAGLSAAGLPAAGLPAAAPVLELDQLTTGYGDLAVVRGVSLCIRPGEVVALFGPNGAGKTTTLLGAVGVLPRTGGQVRWRGEPTRQPLHRLARDGLAFVPEQRSIISGLSARDNLRLGGGSVQDALAEFPELEQHLGKKAGLLSGGQQQMLALARALASKPAALLIDEPSLGLAPLIVQRLLQALRSAAERTGLAVLLVEQQARRALSVADRWYVLNNGTVAAEGRAGDDAGLVESVYLPSLSGTGAPHTPKDTANLP